MENFIGVYENAYDSDYCNQVIDWFECANAAGFGKTRLEREGVEKHFKDDVSTFLSDDGILNFKNTTTLSNKFLDLFWSNYYADYISKFSILNTYARHSVYELKAQKILPGGGYHNWHSEVSTKVDCRRLGVFMLYLNDVEDGGETEFLYYRLRVKPKQGTLIIWPTGYPHTHRGNPPLNETKYILTGWLEFE